MIYKTAWNCSVYNKAFQTVRRRLNFVKCTIQLAVWYLSEVWNEGMKHQKGCTKNT